MWNGIGANKKKNKKQNCGRGEVKTKSEQEGEEVKNRDESRGRRF